MRRAGARDAPGVYLLSLQFDPSSLEGTRAEAPISSGAIAELLTARPGTQLVGVAAAPDALAAHVATFWLPDETIVYIGKAGTSLRARVGQYYSTPLGARSPHAGGWFRKLLQDFPELMMSELFAASGSGLVGWGRTLLDIPDEIEIRLARRWLRDGLLWLRLVGHPCSYVTSPAEYEAAAAPRLATATISLRALLIRSRDP